MHLSGPVERRADADRSRRPTCILQHELKLGGEKRISLSLNVINLFDQKTATFKFQSQLASGQGIDITETQFYNGFNTQALIAAQSLLLDPRFLQEGTGSADQSRARASRCSAARGSA